MQTDFVMVEECHEYSECQPFIDAYCLSNVVSVEYKASPFYSGCKRYPGLAMVYRDRDLVNKGDRGYIFETCSGWIIKMTSVALIALLILIY